MSFKHQDDKVYLEALNLRMNDIMQMQKIIILLQTKEHSRSMLWYTVEFIVLVLMTTHYIVNFKLLGNLFQNASIHHVDGDVNQIDYP